MISSTRRVSLIILNWLSEVTKEKKLELVSVCVVQLAFLNLWYSVSLLMQSQLNEFKSFEGQDMYTGEKIVPIKVLFHLSHVFMPYFFVFDCGWWLFLWSLPAWSSSESYSDKGPIFMGKFSHSHTLFGLMLCDELISL